MNSAVAVRFILLRSRFPPSASAPSRVGRMAPTAPPSPMSRSRATPGSGGAG